MSMVMLKPSEPNASTLPKGILQKQNSLLRDVKSKLASRNKQIGSPPVEIIEPKLKSAAKETDHDVEEHDTHQELDLCERVQHITNQLEKLSNPHPSDKFLRNSEHRGYIMSYPEVLPVYTSSKFHTVDHKEKPFDDFEGSVAANLRQHIDKHKRSAELGLFTENEEILNRSEADKMNGLCDGDNFWPTRYNRISPAHPRDDDPEGTLEELASHLLQKSSTIQSPVNKRISKEKCKQSPSPEHRISSAPQTEKISSVKTDSNKRALNTPSSVVSKAASTLEAVSRRRIHLENNLEALGRTQFSQSIFEILQQLGESGSSFEKARVQARIIDAIGTAQKKKCSSTRPGESLSVPHRKSKIANHHRSLSPSPGPCSTRTLTEFLSTEFEPGDAARSVSPSMRPAPWRINRSRAKRPGYPRMVNNPVPARRATLRLSDQKDAFVVTRATSGASNVSLPNVATEPFRIQKAVHFEPNSTPRHISRTQNRRERPNQNANKPTRRQAELGIIPLGRAQYSALTLSMESVNVASDRGSNNHERSWKQTQDAAVEVSRDEQSSVAQGYERLNQPRNTPSQTATSILSDADMHAMIEAAVRKHIQPSLPSTPVDPEKRLPTPDMSPESEAHSNHRSLQTPVHSPEKSSPNRSCHSRLDVAVGFSRNTSPIYADWNKRTEAATSYEVDESLDHQVRTPESSSSASSSAMQTPCSPLSARSPHVESIRRSAAVHIQTSPVRNAPTPTGDQKCEYHSFSSTKEMDSWSGTDLNQESDIDFSLTAANTFSDGLWLIDRSEGEAPHPTAPEAYEKIAGNVDLCLEPSKSHISAISGSDASTVDNNLHSPDYRLSDGEQPPENRTVSRPDPMTNPLLEILALRASDRFHVTNLTTNERRNVSKLAAQLRSDDGQSAKLDWLVGLSGLKTQFLPNKSLTVRSSSSTESEPVGHHDQNNNKVSEHHETNLDFETRDSIRLPSCSGANLVNGNTKPMDQFGEPMEPTEHPAGDTLELVNPVDSDTTTINDPVYEDDYVTDTSTQSTQ